MNSKTTKSLLFASVVSAALLGCLRVHAKDGNATIQSRGGVFQQRGRITGGLEAGFDSFQEKYTIVDSDTVDSIHEFRSRLRIGYAHGSSFRDYFHTEVRGLLGEGNREYGGSLQLVRILGSNPRSRFSIEADYLQRKFDEGSSFAFSNDLERLYLRTYVRVGITDEALLKLSHRIENIDFAERTEFDYAYTKQHFSLSGENNWGFSTYLNGALKMTAMTIPDSTEIEYTSWTPAIDFRHMPEIRKQIHFQSSLERRLFDDNATRSSFWSLLLNGTLEWPVLRQFGLEINSDSEHYQYDENSDAYYDHLESRNSLLFNWYRSYSTKVGIGPAFAFSLSEAAPDDEYHEMGARCRVDHSSGTRIWLSAWYEVGRRFYDAFDANIETDVESVFSNYAYHRVSLYGTVRILDRLNVNTFVDYQPEDHEREGDDATATLISVSLAYYL